MSAGRDIAPPMKAFIEPDLIVEDPRWAPLGLESLCAAALPALLDRLELPERPYEFALLACDDARIQTLNADHRDQDKATNVLSWPAEDLAPDTDGAAPPAPSLPELGDIAIAYDTCAREAEAQGKSMAAHTTHLIVHGVLHLLGYDHDTEPNATRMETIEAKTLETLGIESPY